MAHIRSTISAVIPTFNEEAWVGELLADLAAQTDPPDEVVVADCRSTDATAAIVAGYGGRLPVRLVSVAARDAAAARNCGAAVATGDYLLFLDADTRLPCDYVGRLRAAADGGGVGVVTSAYRPTGRHPVDVAWAAYVNAYLAIGHRVLRRPRVIGGAMLVARDLHRRLGGFRESMGEFHDREYSRRLEALRPPARLLWRPRATLSNRRQVADGRMRAMLQALPPDRWLVRRVIRPLFRVQAKWSERDDQ